MNIEALGSVARVASAPRINLAGFRPMTIGDIGKPDLGGVSRPIGWAITARSFEIHNQVRLERYATIRENHKASKVQTPIMNQIEGIAARTWRATEPVISKRPHLEALTHWNEVRNQPDVTDEILERAHRARAALNSKADLEKRKLAAMPSPESKVEPVVGPRSGSETKTEIKGAEAYPNVGKQEIKSKQEKKKAKETPKVKKIKKGTIIFKKDEPASTHRSARAKEKFKTIHKEKNGEVILGRELNMRLGKIEILEEQSKLLSQLGLQNIEDGTNLPGFRETIDPMVFNSLEDGLRKIDQANTENIPVRIGGDGVTLTDEYAEKVLQEEREALKRVRAELAQAA